MEQHSGSSLVVLVVEDEKNLADLYTTWLSDSYDVRTAYDADAAIDQLDASVDVVLLDRRLPGMLGDEFLEYIREEGYNCQVAMVSAVDPDFDIVDMGFDDYVVKPVEQEELHRVVKRLMGLDEVSPDSQEYFALVSKKKALEGEKSKEELQKSRDYASLLKSIDAYKHHVIALAEAYLDTQESRNSDKDLQIYSTGISEWQQRQKSLNPNDPLYQAAETQIEEYEQQIERLKENERPKREFLEAVADGFVAEGFWFDSRVRRALNKIFFDKTTDELVIKRTRLEPDVNLSADQLFDISSFIREKAESKL